MLILSDQGNQLIPEHPWKSHLDVKPAGWYRMQVAAQALGGEVGKNPSERFVLQGAIHSPDAIFLQQVEAA